MKPAYQDFLEGKALRVQNQGIEVDAQGIHPLLFDFQRDLTRWAIRKGRAAIFADTGLGKTLMQLEWARLLGQKTLIIAPLSVARQTVREATKVDLDVGYVRAQAEVGQGNLWITNYEMIDAFDIDQFGAIVLDESSILKAISGKTRRKLTKMCQTVPYRLCCTATPAPNDYVELGNHAEFLGICSRSEMLAMFFINANKEHTFFVNGTAYRKKGSNKGGQEWRLKHHAEAPFFRWLASWAMAIRKPSDLGYDDAGFVLPSLRMHKHFVRSSYQPEDQLFFTHIKGLSHQAQIRRDTLPERLKRLESLINGSQEEQWIIWVGLDEEGNAVTAAISESIEVKGSDMPDVKAQAFEDFQDGKFRVLVTKPTIGGFGMNFQNAHKMAFFGLSYSWEQFYQCIRREWRYLQGYPVDVHLVLSDVETGIYQDVMRKDAQAKRLREGLIEQMGDYEKQELGTHVSNSDDYVEAVRHGDTWEARLGDACTRLGEIPDKTIDLSIYSPPFADLYTYSASPRDLGNSRGWEEFLEHYGFIIREVLRATKPGRLTCVHTSDIPALAQKDDYIGIRDFPGAVIKAHEKEGWIFHGRILISKNPQAQAIRTHSKALLFVQLRKDSADSRPALVDHVLIFKKPGENLTPVTPVQNGEMDNDLWVEWANGVWTDIKETETLQYHHARGVDDEKHICPLQLATIERCVKLYSNPGEMVLSPFAGIGSEGYESIRAGRRFLGIELKREYFDQMVRNLSDAEAVAKQPDLFAVLEETPRA